MVLCPLAMSDFSDAEGTDLNELETLDLSTITGNELYKDGVVSLNKDYKLSGTLSTNLTILGNGHTLYGMLRLDAYNTSGTETLTVVLDNLTLNGDGTNSTYGVHSQNQGEKGGELDVRALDLTMTGCKVMNYDNKGMYITNCVHLRVEKCEFNNVATADESISAGDHAVDVVLAGVQDSVMEFIDNKFVGNVGHNAAIQIQQRGGAGSGIDDAGDIQFNVAASIDHVLFQNNDFSQSNAEVDIRLGSWPTDTEGDERTYSKAFDTTVISNGDTVVASCTEKGSEGKYNPELDIQLGLSDSSTLKTTGSTQESSDGKKTGALGFDLESGSAVISGILPEYMSVEVSPEASAYLNDLQNRGKIVSYDNNVTGQYTGNAVDNTDTIITPPIWDDDDDYVPPIVPSQTGESGDDDTVTIVACAAAAVVAALLAAFLNIDRKH